MVILYLAVRMLRTLGLRVFSRARSNAIMFSCPERYDLKDRSAEGLGAAITGLVNAIG
jgi:hypothetical protein